MYIGKLGRRAVLRDRRIVCLGRAIFATCQFDESACDLGLKRLRHYRKEWDDDHGVWKDRSRHDDSSHGADAFLTFACSDYEPPRPYKQPEVDLAWVV